MRTTFDIVYYQDKKLDIYLPDNDFKDIIVFFHGGGLVEGYKWQENYVEIARALTDNGYAFVSVEYSLYPNAKFPCYLVESASAIKYIQDRFENRSLFVAGQSAGAWITLMLCFDKHYLFEQKVNTDLIKGYICDSGQTTSHFHILKYELNEDPRLQRIDKHAPLYFVNEHSDLKPLYLMVYDNDMPLRIEQNTLLMATIKNFNPSADVTMKILSGWHCQGSCKPEENGEYRFAKETLNWIKSR